MFSMARSKALKKYEAMINSRGIIDIMVYYPFFTLYPGTELNL